MNSEKSSEEPEPRHISEFLNEAMHEITRSREVKLDRDDTLTFRAAPEYELDAREFDTKSGLLRWLSHLTRKSWFTWKCLVDLLAVLIGREDRRRAATTGGPRR